MPLLARADVVVEQFRPGVMERLGIGYAQLKEANPRLVYCAITGHGADGPRAQDAGHDLNYLAETGMLMLSVGADGAPVVPPALIADIGGGAYPAVINILMALQRRASTGEGCRLDVSMTDNLFPFMYWAMGRGLAEGQWPRPGGEMLTGGSPRYRVYRTADDRFIAAAPLEDRFWQNFCDAIGLPPALRDDAGDPRATIAGVASLIRAHPAAHWQHAFAGKDVCCALAATLEEAARDPHFRARGLFDWGLAGGGRRIAAMPMPLAPEFRAASRRPPLSRARRGQRLARRRHAVKAILCRAAGPPENLALADVPEPAPGAGEVAIAARAIGVNYPDLLVVEGRYQRVPPAPFVPGKDVAGIVAAVGPGVADFKPGDRVLAALEHGAYAEMALAPAKNCWKLPALACRSTMRRRWGWSIRRRISRSSSARTIAPARPCSCWARRAAWAWPRCSLRRRWARASWPACRILRARHLRARRAPSRVIDLGQPNLRDALREEVRAATDGAMADIVLDPVGGDAFDAALRALAWRGRLVVVGFAAGRIPEAKANYLLLRNISVAGLQWSDYRERWPSASPRCRRNSSRSMRPGRSPRASPRACRLARPLPRCAWWRTEMSPDESCFFPRP